MASFERVGQRFLEEFELIEELWRSIKTGKTFSKYRDPETGKFAKKPEKEQIGFLYIISLSHYDKGGKNRNIELQFNGFVDDTEEDRRLAIIKARDLLYEELEFGALKDYGFLIQWIDDANKGAPFIHIAEGVRSNGATGIQFFPFREKRLVASVYDFDERITRRKTFLRTTDNWWLG